VFFTVPLSVAMWPWNRDFIFPHERMTVAIHLAFIFAEVILGIRACNATSMKTRTSFHLRTAPLVDKMFIKKQLNHAKDVGAKREIELGVQSYDPSVDAQKNPFVESEKRIIELDHVR
jgi:hypothetical protein